MNYEERQELRAKVSSAQKTRAQKFLKIEQNLARQGGYAPPVMGDPAYNPEERRRRRARRASEVPPQD